MISIFWMIAILVIFLCGIGIIVCMGIAAERIENLIKGGYKDEDGQQNL